MTRFSFPHSPGRNSILSMLGWMGVVHWLDESAPKIAKRDRCRGACTVYHGIVHSASACASIPFVASLLTMPMLLDCSSGCCVWDFVAGILLYYGGSWVTCFTFSMAVPATASSGLPATLQGCAGWWWSTTLHPSSRRSQEERSPAMSMPLGCVQWMLLSERCWCHDLHLSRDQNLLTCCT